jgi:hypothetical protein
MSYLGGKQDLPFSIGDVEYADNDLLNRVICTLQIIGAYTSCHFEPYVNKLEYSKS